MHLATQQRTANHLQRRRYQPKHENSMGTSLLKQFYRSKQLYPAKYPLPCVKLNKYSYFCQTLIFLNLHFLPFCLMSVRLICDQLKEMKEFILFSKEIKSIHRLTHGHNTMCGLPQDSLMLQQVTAGRNTSPEKGDGTGK